MNVHSSIAEVCRPLWFRLVVIVTWLPNDCGQVLLCGKSTELCVFGNISLLYQKRDGVVVPYIIN